jgi:AcrR family transcriptional regulator
VAEAMPEQPAPRPLPPGLDLLWGRRERGKRGPRPGLSADAIVEAAIRLADAEGLEAVSMARVAAELGFTTMSLYRHVANKEELLQLMWNGSALGAEHLVIEGDGWRSRLRDWAVIQRDMLDRHPWITQMPMAAPPVAPNSLHFVERGLQTMDDTGLPDPEKLQFIGLISSYTLSEARMAADARRAALAAMAAMAAARPASDGQADTSQSGTGPGGTGPGGDGAGADSGTGETGGTPGPPEDSGPPEDYGALLRELVDERTYPRLYRLAWTTRPVYPATEREQFLFGIDTILDGIQARIDRITGG